MEGTTVELDSFGKWLRHQRQREGMTQAQLAELVGVDRTYINKIERGKVEMPQFELRQRLGGYLGFTDDDLRSAGFLEDSIPEEDTVIVRLERRAAEAISEFAETHAGGRIRITHENLEFLAMIARLARDWTVSQKQAALRSIQQSESIAESPAPYDSTDPNDPRARIYRVVEALPDPDDLDGLAGLAEWWEGQVAKSHRVITAPEEPAFYRVSPTWNEST